MKTVYPVIPFIAVLLTGCIATAPVTVAWRSNASQQTAATNGTTNKAEDANTVNADRMTETQAAVSTSSGSAATSEQSATNKGQK